MTTQDAIHSKCDKDGVKQIQALKCLVTCTWADALLSSALTYTINAHEWANVEDAYDHLRT